ncbi:radical SAM family heme chaperone HemW [Oceanivirga miroungae]|uniref:Heme chaperone HemW n=1 Tax=Oceanivirga miroungae TaxID=1130046 RepID=A0A6I8MD82_9FUSO|nr:radical SAM family heme chaperone HemW [Oceanivirga miroungae]VWL85400.1 putative oxygen independent coproporphyrinogen III oxidase [Oceanivirga miroungae]
MIKSKIDAIYIHIPFCNIRCSYCDFYILTNMQREYERYVEYIIKEINLYPKLEYDTIYFGGGTPSVLSISSIEKILSNLKFNENTEISLELNPTNMDLEKLMELKKLGVNRLSIGIQSFNDDILKLMRREHNKEDGIKTFYDAKKAGFSNISIDLIFAVPSQTLKDLENDLNQIEILKPDHISIYSLIWEEKSRFSKLLKEKKITKLSDELEEKMYLYIIDRLTKMGYTHYEVSSFCLSNKLGRHNIKYWENKEFIGVGISSSSYYDNKRFEKIKKLKEYYRYIDENKIPINEKTIEIVDEKELENLKYIMGLRLLNKGVIYDPKKEKIVNKLIENNLVYLNDGKIFLTKKGLLLSDTVTVELMD